VINTGQFSAPGGQITVAAVRGENAVRISQVGNLLSLEITPSLLGEKSPIAPVALAQLLTGPGVQEATGLTTNAQGQLVLTGGKTVPTDGGSAIVSGSVNVFSASPGIGGTIDILGEKVGLFGANLNASGSDGAGTVRVGGGLSGSVTYVSPDSTIALDAIDRGNGGTVIISAEDTTRFFGKITALGGHSSGDGGKVEVAGKNSLTFQGNVDTRATNGAIGTLRLASPNMAIANSSGDNSPASTTSPFASAELQASSEQDQTVTSISESQLEQMTAGNNVVVDTTSDITIEDLLDNKLGLQARTGDTVTFRSGGVFFVNDPNYLIETQGGNINIEASSISLGRINANGGNIALTANGIDFLSRCRFG